ncbi:helix-turn-helix domain-containing protein [Humisphaera borealis]|uniref:Helix-turn-helix domain-containing protein n=1 Tax=Humisphaera borealis TaxID=2807512 RepID=A0A7M2X085_9BACT|nr:helix-turn-helix domain-containing protein [Humisphaera borealis]QOV91064.1 helix-turn-helix domain-containing protein [Humisphaera borealis]
MVDSETILKRMNTLLEQIATATASPLRTADEAAEYLRVSRRTLHGLPVPRCKVGGQIRYDVADLNEYIAKSKA